MTTDSYDAVALLYTTAPGARLDDLQIEVFADYMHAKNDYSSRGTLVAITTYTEIEDCDTLRNYYDMHGFFYEERSGLVLDALNRLRVLFPGAVTAHPGQGAPGAFNTLIDKQEEYTETARSLVARALSDGLGRDALIAKVTQQLNTRYPAFGIPGGQPNMVELSVAGLAEELSTLRATAAGQRP